MAIRTLILAGSPREGGHYAKRAGLDRWTYRVVHAAGQVRGLPWAGCEVHVLPSFAKLPQRASILSALRYKRGLEYFYVDPDDLPTLEELDSQKQAEHLGELDDETLDAAYAEHEAYDHVGFAHRQAIAKLESMTPEEIREWIAAQNEVPAEVAVEAVKAVKPRKPRQPATIAPTDVFGAED